MDNYPVISIITPSYNQGRFIEDTILSVLTQKGKFYIDYIINDGGSNDGSVHIIEKYETLLQKNCSITHRQGLKFFVNRSGAFPLCNCLGISYRWSSGRDNGQSHALNKGIYMSAGDYIAWINSDDYYAGPDVFRTVIDFFSEHPDCGLAYGRGYCVDEQKKIVRDYHDNTSTLSFDRNILKYECFILQPSAFMKRDALIDAGGVDESLHWCMDWNLWLGISASRAVGFIPAWLACWRQYEGIKTLEPDYQFYRERYSVIRKHSSFFGYVLNKWYFFMNYPGQVKHHIWLKYGPGRFKMAFFYLPAVAARTLLRACMRIAGKRFRRPGPERLAIFAPLEPEQTGVATFFTQLLAAMVRAKPGLFIDIYIKDGYEPVGFSHANVRILNHAHFHQNALFYNTVFYQLGNHFGFHGYMLPYLKKYGGIVEMHDIRIQGIYSYIIDRLREYLKKAKLWKVAWLFISYPELNYFIAAKILKPFVSKKTIMNRCFYRNSFTVRNAKKIIIRDMSICSRFSLPEKKCSFIIHGIDIKPLPDESSINQTRRRLNIKPGQFVIVTAGIIHNSKRIDKILAAIKLIREEINDFIYILAGESIWEGGSIQALVESHGLTENVRITGWLSNEDWFDYITVADIGINLRGDSAGEHSGPLVNFIERGKVVLISDYDQYRIYPDEFAIKIRHDAEEEKNIARAILRLYDNPEYRRQAGAQARRYAESELNFDGTIIQEYLEALGLK